MQHSLTFKIEVSELARWKEVIRTLKKLRTMEVLIAGSYWLRKWDCKGHSDCKDVLFTTLLPYVWTAGHQWQCRSPTICSVIPGLILLYQIDRTQISDNKPIIPIVLILFHSNSDYLLVIGIIFILNFYENIRTDDNGDWKSPSCNKYSCIFQIYLVYYVLLFVLVCQVYSAQIVAQRHQSETNKYFQQTARPIVQTAETRLKKKG